MGCAPSKSCKDAKLVQHLMENTGFTEPQIHMLYRRFRMLDNDKKDFLTADDFRSIHDFSLNPLANRIIFAMYREKDLEDDHPTGRNITHHTRMHHLDDALRNPGLENVRISFESFVRCFARFRVFHDAQVDTSTERITIPTQTGMSKTGKKAPTFDEVAMKQTAWAHKPPPASGICFT